MKLVKSTVKSQKHQKTVLTAMNVDCFNPSSYIDIKNNPVIILKTPGNPKTVMFLCLYFVLDQSEQYTLQFYEPIL